MVGLTQNHIVILQVSKLNRRFSIGNMQALLILSVLSSLTFSNSTDTFWRLLGRTPEYRDSVALANHWQTDSSYSIDVAEFKEYRVPDLWGLSCPGRLQVISFFDSVSFLMWFADSGTSNDLRVKLVDQLVTDFQLELHRAPVDKSGFFTDFEWAPDPKYLNISAYPKGTFARSPVAVGATLNQYVMVEVAAFQVGHDRDRPSSSR
jgi:hypothetical protein